jgi:cation:H+ antiporter
VDVAVQLGLLVGGLALALVASDVAVAYARSVAAALGAPAFVVGVVLVGVGTDLPEIANSIAAHIQDQGDVNVGDSVGSALTQDTLVLGIAPFIAGTLLIVRRQIGLVTGLTVAGLSLAAWAVSDGYLSRLDGALLVLAWVVFTVIVVRVLGGTHVADVPPEVRVHSMPGRAAVLLVALLLVGAGATAAVHALVDLAETLGVPEFALAFFGASIGTSAPEIVVVLTALARGAPAIALGDALGSSLADASLSIGSGPLVAPAEVTARLGVVGSLYTLAGIAVVGLLLVVRRRHDRVSGVALLGIYLLAYAVLIAAD